MIVYFVLLFTTSFLPHVIIVCDFMLARVIILVQYSKVPFLVMKYFPFMFKHCHVFTLHVICNYLFVQLLFIDMYLCLKGPDENQQMLIGLPFLKM